MSHTFSTLEVSPSAYDEIKGLLKKAGYEHAFTPSGAIDMHGIGLTRANVCYGFNAAPGADPCEGNLGHMVWDPTHAKDEHYTCERHHAVAVRRAKLEGLEVEPL